jgi:S-methylmethionine-dependent homocysteine/selenocysteine methylase
MERICLLDGGTGRELLRIGAPFGQPEWSARALWEAPEFVTRVHEAFVAAGAEVITTNSYAVVPFHLGPARFEADGLRLAALSGRLAREVADRSARAVAVAGGLSPPCGSYLADHFDPVVARPILATLVNGLEPSVDHWLAETLSTVVEAELVREVIGEKSKPLWLSFTLADDEDPSAAPRLRSGESVADAVAAAVRLGAAAVLYNCSRPEVMGSAVTEAAQVLSELGTAARSVRIGVYANAFVPLNPTIAANEGLTALRGDVTPAAYLRWARDWVERGARIVGGCCGVGPEHIALLRSLNAS